MQHDDLDLVAHVEDLGGMADAPPAHVRHVQQTVDAAEVDERAVVRDVLHGAGERHTLRQHFHRVLLLFLPLLLEYGAAREDHVAAAAIELDDLRADQLANHRREVLHRAQIDLGARQECLDADVDGQAALDDLDDAPLHRDTLLVRARDGVADLGQLPAEFLRGDRALALVADVDEDLAAAHVDDAAANDLAFLELVGGDALIEPVFHALLGLLVATLLPQGAEGFTVILLHAAHSSRRYFEALGLSILPRAACIHRRDARRRP